ncbi:hypothetical protein [Ruegeria profundi]|uniref:hypothetical protein n=1 Tax=Ruegeria profundi TaxID=1685378 RepID=UPI001CD5C1B8|nr:hypothetical protein [Ruegeria profundi]MCA0930174.1 hypothetical protein [Ruegeria profundi]
MDWLGWIEWKYIATVVGFLGVILVLGQAHAALQWWGKQVLREMIDIKNELQEIKEALEGTQEQ